MRLDEWIEWHVASRPIAGETVCGDACLAAPHPEGLLLAVVDGLGHGEGAAKAAERACDVLRAASEADLDALVQRCHRALHGTRGAALTVALVRRRGHLSWLGVGNVEAVVVRAASGRGRAVRDSLMLQPGVVGYQIQSPRTAETEFAPGDTLVMATDGIKSSFVEALAIHDDPARTAATILDAYGKLTDDALVLAAARLRSAE